MSAFDDFTRSKLRSQPVGPSVNVRSTSLTPIPTFSIVIPIHNLEGELAAFVHRLETLLRGQFYEVVFIDDGSTDNTWDEIRTAVRRHRNWQALRMTRAFGVDAAIAAGLEAARGRAVITMLADGRHTIELIPKMVQHWRDGARVVEILCDQTAATTRLKRIVSRATTRVVSYISGMTIDRRIGDFRLMDRRIVDTINAIEGPPPCLRGLVPWMGFASIQIVQRPQIDVATSMHGRLHEEDRNSIYEYLRRSPKPFSPLRRIGRLATTSAIVMLSLMAVGGMAGISISAWSIMAGMIALVTGIQIYGAGLFGEYISTLFSARRTQPAFVVADTCGSSNAGRSDAIEGDTRATAANRHGESVKLITAHIGDAEQAHEPGQRNVDVVSRIDSMRREEAVFSTVAN